MPKVIFNLPDGTQREFEVAVGKTLLDIAWDNQLNVEGACGGVMACSTCHMIVDAAWASRLETPGQEEDEMLDLAWGVTKTSRLGCQIKVTEALDGLVVSLPTETRNLLD
ncbi:MAG: 2Fe-2S ferredoxin [Rhodospirillaceae bacterium]|nr:2Fe-2S ferredoxin [Rhodospirillaceae bacterium]|tara:strand:+ start:29052 stop:29381 length:330 start_codon:yes stop_codon:yes gene_type:complete